MDNGAIERWTRLVLPMRWPVLGPWLVVLIAGGLASNRLGVLLSNGFGVPGSDSAQAQAVLARQLGDRSDGEYLIVFKSERPPDRGRTISSLKRQRG